MPGFEEKSLVVISFETNDLDVFKVLVVADTMSGGHGLQLSVNFGVLVKTCHCLFVLHNLGLNDLSVWP